MRSGFHLASFGRMSVAVLVLASVSASPALADDDVELHIQQLESAGDESMRQYEYETAARQWREAYRLISLDKDFGEPPIELLEKLTDVQLLLARMYHDQHNAGEWLRRSAESCLASQQYLETNAGIYAQFLAAECRAAIRTHRRNLKNQTQPSKATSDVSRAEHLHFLSISDPDYLQRTQAQSTTKQLEQGQYWAAFDGLKKK